MTVAEAISPEGYPRAILEGDVVSCTYKAVRRRLKALFPETSFRHVVLPPHATKQTWQEIANITPCVAVGIGGWKAASGVNNTFVGDLTFPLAVLQSQSRSDDLYLGTGTVRGIGVAGIMAAIAGGLNGWTLPDVGSCKVHAITLPLTEDWFGDRSAVVMVELVFSNVALDNREALAELEDFVAGRTTVKMKKESGDE